MLIRFGERPWAYESWRELENMQNEFNRLFERFEQTASPGYPAMNMWAGEEDTVITAELPGVTPEAIDISVKGETLTLSGTREETQDAEKYTYHRRERTVGPFPRTLRLPYRVDAGKVEAKFHNGVLTIRLPRAEEDKPKKIAIH